MNNLRNIPNQSTQGCHIYITILAFSSVQFSRSVVSDCLQPHESQHTRPPCPSPTPRVYSNSCSSSQWCHPAISSSVVPFSSYPQSFPASGSFPMSQSFTWGGQSIGVSASASVLPMNTQGWSLLVVYICQSQSPSMSLSHPFSPLVTIGLFGHSVWWFSLGKLDLGPTF